MIVDQPKSFRHGDENMLPMINIVFLLLIFFMLAGVISAADRFKISPPQVSAASATQSGGRVLLVSADGRLAVGQQDVTLDQLAERMADQMAERLAAGSEPLQLKVDANTPSATLFEVLQALNAAGVKSVRLLATSK